MTAVSQFNPVWLAHLHARASAPPLRQRVDLMAAGERVGSIIAEIPKVLDEIAIKSPSNINSLLCKRERTEGGEDAFSWQIDGDLSQVLNQIALSLRDADLERGASDRARHVATHLRHHWRDEQLAVTNAQGVPLGSVERGAVRALGIATRAVHLVGCSPDGRFWVQQRSFAKSNDPGQWDTLMGGMVSAQDSVDTALVRETWEEAGLHVAALGDVVFGGRITVTRPSGDEVPPFEEARTLGIGYLVETTDWFQATVPDGLVPVNQDGEVVQFELLDADALVSRLENNEFTLEAALILVAALGQQSKGVVQHGLA